MADLLSYFENIPKEYRTIFLVGGLSVLTLLESSFPLLNFKYKKIKHISLNLFFTLTTVLINLAGASLILYASIQSELLGFGLLKFLDLPLVFEILIGIMFLDLVGAWLVHFLEHKVRFMWRFHIIHHTDPFVDASTGLRHHPGEAIFRLTFTSLAVFLSGASFGIVMLYQTLSVFFAHWTHANIKIPTKFDSILSYVFVTPDFHKVHHHFALPKTDSHYGNIFSLWDHIFNCSVKNYKIQSIKYGLDTHMDIKETRNIKTLLLIPFQKYRAPRGSKFSA